MIRLETYAQKGPEHRGDQAYGKGEESLNRITEDSGRARRKQREKAFLLPHHRCGDQQDQQQHGGKAMIQQLRKILVMRIVKISRQGYAVLLIRNGKPVIPQVLVKAQDKGVGPAAKQKLFPGKLKRPEPDSNPVAAERQAQAAMENLMQFPEAAAGTGPEPCDQKHQYQHQEKSGKASSWFSGTEKTEG